MRNKKEASINANLIIFSWSIFNVKTNIFFSGNVQQMLTTVLFCKCMSGKKND